MADQFSQDELTITLDDLKSYAVGGTDNKVYKIWNRLLETLPTADRESVQSKGFDLVDDPTMENTPNERYFQLKSTEVDGALKIRCSVR